MENLNGIWWTYNKKKVVGNLTITDNNRMYLTTFEKLEEPGIINGIVETEKFTLVDAHLDTTNNYYDNEKDENLLYSTYKYIIDIAIKGNFYERKGDITLNEIWIKYTYLNEWADLNIPKHKIDNNEKSLIIEFEKSSKKFFDIQKFHIRIVNRLFNDNSIQISNNAEVYLKNFQNKYIISQIAAIEAIRYFLILCVGNNINIEKVLATDEKDENVEIIISYGKNNFDNRNLFKNIIKYKNIEKNFDEIIENWINLYEENELLVSNFINLHTREELIITQYIAVMTCIDSLHLMITNQEQTKESFKNIVEKLLKETNFILQLTEKQIEDLAIRIKEIRRYFVHSNKTQKEMVTENISNVRNIVMVLIEVLRARIMIEIGIEKEIIKKYYDNYDEFKNIKENIVIEANDEDEIYDDGLKGRNEILKPLTKREREYIAQMNSCLRTTYRETSYNLENTDDLIEAAQNAAAELMDYMNYAGMIAHIVEEFDQSLEVFNPEKWMKVTVEGETGDNLIDEVFSNISEAEHNMYKLAFATEEKCKYIWEYLLLGNDVKAKEFFVGDISQYSEEEIKQALNDTLENIYEVPYNDQVQKDAENFGKTVKEILEESRK